MPCEIILLETRRPRDDICIRVDVMIEAICRQIEACSMTDIGIILVSEPIVVSPADSLDLCRSASALIEAFVQAPDVRRVVVGMTRVAAGVELTVWGCEANDPPPAARGFLGRLGGTNVVRPSSGRVCRHG